jgi:large subunit ribosomal protein L9e
MKFRLVTEKVKIPKGVTAKVEKRVVTIEGSRGTLQRSFRARALTIKLEGDEITVEIWNTKSKQKSTVHTICTHIKNMITGVTRGFLYKMRFVYAHFPITGLIDTDDHISIRNFLGEKRHREVHMIGDTKIKKSEDVKDQIEIFGNNVEHVGRSCALIHQATLVRNKDIRKFLDGVYVSEKGHIEAAEQ